MYIIYVHTVYFRRSNMYRAYINSQYLLRRMYQARLHLGERFDVDLKMYCNIVLIGIYYYIWCLLFLLVLCISNCHSTSLQDTRVY